VKIFILVIVMHCKKDNLEILIGKFMSLAIAINLA
jgi:hypothetical protein